MADSRRDWVSLVIGAMVGFAAALLIGFRLLAGVPDQPFEPSLSDRADEAASTSASSGASSEVPPAEAGPDRRPIAAVDVSGSWVVTNRVEASSYRAFTNLLIEYDVRFTQDGDRIVGKGHKRAENGKRLPVSRRTPIAIEGTVAGDRLDLRFTEQGARRASGGAFAMEVVDERTLRGTFTSDAASSRGSSVAVREGARAQ